MKKKRNKKKKNQMNKDKVNNSMSEIIYEVHFNKLIYFYFRF